MSCCRTCLGPLDLPINLFGPNYANLLDVLQRLLAFQVFIKGGEFKVCWHCQGKLMWISEFQDVCIKSLQPFRNVNVKPRDDVTETDEQCNYDVYVKTEYCNAYDEDYEDNTNETRNYKEVLELLQPVEVRLTRCPRIEELISSSKNQNCTKIMVNQKPLYSYENNPYVAEVDQSMHSDSYSDSSASESSDTDIDLDDDLHHKTRTNNNEIETKRDHHHGHNDSSLQDSASSDYSQSLADAIIDWLPIVRTRKPRNPLYKKEELKLVHLKELQLAMKEMYNSKRVFRSMKCCFCDFVAKNSTGIKQHMSRSHKSVKNWCNICNIIADDMEAHRKVSRCHLWQCTICEKYFKNLKNLKIHVTHHQIRTECSSSVELPDIAESRTESISAQLSTAPVEQDEEMANALEKSAHFLEDAVTKLSTSENNLIVFNDDIEKQLNTIAVFKINKYPIAENTDLNNTSGKSLKPFIKRGRKESNLKRPCNTPESQMFAQFPAAEVNEAIAKLKCSFNDTNRCMFCDYVGKYQEFLRAHVLSKHKDKCENWCDHCNELTENIHVHRNIMRCYKFDCTFCKIPINNGNDLIVHMYSHGGFEDAVKTEFIRSGRLFYRQYPEYQVKQAIADYNEFTTRKKLHCLYCEHSATNTVNLVYHMREKHKPLMANWCKDCNLETHNLEIHLSTTLCIPRKCTFCMKVYRKDILFNHLRVHCRISALLDHTALVL